jgi:hypothetical protein
MMKGWKARRLEGLKAQTVLAFSIPAFRLPGLPAPNGIHLGLIDKKGMDSIISLYFLTGSTGFIGFFIHHFKMKLKNT